MAMGFQGGLGEGIDRIGIPGEGATMPGIVENRSQRDAFLASGLLAGT